MKEKKICRTSYHHCICKNQTSRKCKYDDHERSCDIDSILCESEKHKCSCIVSVKKCKVPYYKHKCSCLNDVKLCKLYSGHDFGHKCTCQKNIELCQADYDTHKCVCEHDSKKNVSMTIINVSVKYRNNVAEFNMQQKIINMNVFA